MKYYQFTNKKSSYEIDVILEKNLPSTIKYLNLEGGHNTILYKKSELLNPVH